MDPEFEDEFEGDADMIDLIRDAMLQADLDDIDSEFSQQDTLEVYDPDYYDDDVVSELDFTSQDE